MKSKKTSRSKVENRNSSQRSDGIDDFFLSTDSPTSFAMLLSKVIFIVSIALSASWIYIFYLKQNRVQEIYGHKIDSLLDPALELIGFVASSLIAISASLIAVYFVNRANYRRIDAIKNLSNEDALKTVFRVLHGYNNRVANSKDIRLTFKSFLRAENGLCVIKCELETTTTMAFTRDKLLFEFAKLRRDDVKGAFVERSLFDPDVPDDLFSLDVTDIVKALGADQEETLFKGLTEVSVDTNWCPVKVDKLDPNRIRYTVDIKDIRKNSSIIPVRYKFEYAVECPGHTFFNVSEPTKKFSCTIDYSEVIDLVSVYHIDMLNSKMYHHDVTPHPTGKINISVNDWIVPQSAVVFCWYLKDADGLSRQARENLQRMTMMKDSTYGG